MGSIPTVGSNEQARGRRLGRFREDRMAIKPPGRAEGAFTAGCGLKSGLHLPVFHGRERDSISCAAWAQPGTRVSRAARRTGMQLRVCPSHPSPRSQSTRFVDSFNIHFTCVNGKQMPKMVQIRNMPDEIHREAKVRATRAGMSLSAFLLKEIERSLALPSGPEFLSRIASREPIRQRETAAEALRAEREARW